MERLREIHEGNKFQKNRIENLSIQEKEPDEQKQEHEEPREQQKYENKYLEEIRKMPKEYILTSEEIEIKNKKNKGQKFLAKLKN